MPIDRNLTISLVRATEAAALAAGRWVGRGDIQGADIDAAHAMHDVLKTIQMDGQIIIGEERRYKDMEFLHSGASIGTGEGPQTDVVVDVVEGTSLLVHGQPGTISVVAIAPRATIPIFSGSRYMNKLVAGIEAAGVLGPEALSAPPAWVLGVLARATGKSVRDLTVYILDRKRHSQLIQDVRTAGARVLLRQEADLLGALLAALPNTSVDIMMGIGGTPEGIVGAIAVESLSSVFLGQLAPQDQEELERIRRNGLNLRKIWTGGELMPEKDTIFAATGVTDSTLLPGVRYHGRYATTHSLVLRGSSKTRRMIAAEHQIDEKGNLY